MNGALIGGALMDHFPAADDHNNLAFRAIAVAKDPDLRSISVESAHSSIAVAILVAALVASVIRKAV